MLGLLSNPDVWDPIAEPGCSRLTPGIASCCWWKYSKVGLVPFGARSGGSISLLALYYGSSFSRTVLPSGLDIVPVSHLGGPDILLQRGCRVGNSRIICV